MNARSIPVLLALLVVVSLVPSAMAAGFEISASDTTPVPERTVTFEGNSFTFDSMIRADQGDTVSVDVTAPSDDTVYRLHVRNSDNEIVESLHGDGDESFSLDLSGYDHGSYVVAVYHDGNYEKAQPLLVSGYDVSVDAPPSMSSGDSVAATVDVLATAASSNPADVKIIVAQGETTHEFDASGNDGEYTATIDGGELDDGEYTVYAVAQGDEEAFGRSELLGLSNGHSLSVTSDSSNSDDSGSDSNDGSDSADGSDSTNESESTDDSDSTDGGAANPPENESTNETATTTVTESPTATPTETATETASPTETTTATETDDGVITPGNDTATESTGASGPGFTAVGTIAALTLVALLGRRRS